MQIKKDDVKDKKKDSVLTVGMLFSKMKKFFVPWIIAAVVIALLNLGISGGKRLVTGTVSSVINFSFDGIESGLDPAGNKFDVNEIKSKDIIRESLKETGLDGDVNHIYSHINIDGVVPLDVIERITKYDSIYNSDVIVSSKSIQDTSYYPTQYKIVLECSSETGLSKKEGALLLNKITEKYREVFYNNYGYNSSLESAVVSIDYTEYDYVDAVDVFDSSLGSLKNYIDELAASDNTRFRSETGYTFADLSSSIDTVRNEDLDWISSYITLNNVTKDKKNLIANYKFKIEDLKRSKIISEEQLKAVSETIEVYEKNSILIFSNATDAANASLTQSSDTYDNLITQKIEAQANLSACEQNIKRYEERIKSLENGASTAADEEVVDAELKKISGKIDTLINTVNETASEYYEKVLFSNAYTVLTPASTSVTGTLKAAVSDSVDNIFMFELILAALYVTVSVAFALIKTPMLTKKFAGRKNRRKTVKNRK